MNLRAISVGRRAAVTLKSGTTGRVLASFRQVCDLVTEEGDIVALARSGSEQGPLTVLLEPDAAGDLCTHLAPGAPFSVGNRELWLSGRGSQQVQIDFAGAASWEPALPWEALRRQRERIGDSARITAGVVAEESLAGAGPRWESRLQQVAQEVVAAHGQRNRDGLRAAIRELCGLGEGLTPQGDDWLAGWLLGLRLADPTNKSDPELESLGKTVLEAAAARTTLLSYAFLTCAAAGEAAEGWHVLLDRMARGPSEKAMIEDATRRNLSHGATSGTSMLKGFLAGLDTGQTPNIRPA
jgi:hypothetical protein